VGTHVWRWRGARSLTPVSGCDWLGRRYVPCGLPRESHIHTLQLQKAGGSELPGFGGPPALPLRLRCTAHKVLQQTGLCKNDTVANFVIIW
jgi:hypothetical protein